MCISNRRPRDHVPKGGLAIGALLGDLRSASLTSRALETSSGRVRLAGHGGVGRGRTTGAIGRGAILVGEGIEVLERHFGAEIKLVRKT